MERKYPIFDPGKVDFCNTFEMIEGLCIVITYGVYWNYWEFLSTTHCNLANFLENLGEVSDEQGEKWHQHLNGNGGTILR